MIIQEKLYKDSRIKFLTDKKELIDIEFNEAIKQRTELEKYIEKNKIFKTSLKPINTDKHAPKIAKLMAIGGKTANVGPMAAVAGTIAEFAARAMIKAGAKTALVENGGDIFIITDKKLNIGLFSTNKAIQNLGFEINKQDTPLSICSSSSFLGHSLSFGKCDLATIFSEKSYVADAVATAVGNKVKSEEDIKKTLDWAISLKDVKGLMIIKNNKIGIIGKIPKLIKHSDKKIKEKVTKDPVYQF